MPNRSYLMFYVLECSDGKYGSGCSGDCGHCKDGVTCHHVNGDCDSCAYGWEGNKCVQSKL